MTVRSTVKSIQDIMRQDTGVDGDAQRISQLCWMFFLKIIDDQDQELELLSGDYRSPIPEKYQWRTWAADPEGMTGEELLTFVNSELFRELKSLAISTKHGDRRRVVKDVFEDAYNYMKSGQLMRQVINKINAVDFNSLADRQHFGDIYEQILNDLQSAGNAGEYYTPRAVTAFMAEQIDPRPGEILFDPACGTGGFLTSALRHMRERYVKTPKQEHTMQSALRAVEKKQLPHMLCVTNMLLHGIEDPSFVRHDNTLARPYISWEHKDRVDIVLTNPPFGGREETGIESNFPAHFRTRETADLFLALIIRLLKSGGRAAVVLPDGSLFGEGLKTRLREHLMEECNLHTIVRLPSSVFKPYASVGTNLLFFEKGAPTKEIWYYEHRVPENQKAYSMTKPIRIEYLHDCVEWWGGTKRTGRKETPQAWKITIEEVKARDNNLDFKNPHAAADDHSDPEELLAQLRIAVAEMAKIQARLRSILGTVLATTNSSRLAEHYALVAEAPDAIARLRRLTLDLAVRGKLVAQNPSEGSALGLLSAMTSEKARLVKSRELRKPRDLNNGAAIKEPFTVPSTWQWVRLDTIGAIVGGGTPPAGDPDNFAKPGQGIPWLTPSDLGGRSNPFISCGARDLSEKGLRTSSATLMPEGTVLFTSRAPIGYVAIAANPISTNQGFKSIVPYVRECSRYIATAMRAFAPEINARAPSTTFKEVSGKIVAGIAVPLPPLAEQHRIVDKVDEMMGLCDRLEQQLTDTASLKSRLFGALVNDATAAV